MLQELELQNERRAPWFEADVEIAGIDADDRRAPDIRADQPLGRFYAGSVDQRAVDARFARACVQNCTFPSEGGRAGGRCTAGRVTFGRGGGIGRMAAGWGAAASGGGSGMRGIVSQPPGISSACAVAPRDSAATVESAIAATNIATFCISDRTPHCTKRRQHTTSGRVQAPGSCARCRSGRASLKPKAFGGVLGREVMAEMGDESTTEPTTTLDATGLLCPLPVLKTRRALKTVPPGGILEVLATDPGATKDFEHFCQTTGCELVQSSEEAGGVLRFRLKKLA